VTRSTRNYVLFICVHNACRSMMAEAMFNVDPPEGWTARSAGTAPARAADPRSGPMLREIGLELPAHPPRALEPTEMNEARIRVTMGCLDDESCPARLKQLPVRDWGLDDPARLDDAGFRRVRTEIADRIRELKREIARAPTSDPLGPAPSRA